MDFSFYFIIASIRICILLSLISFVFLSGLLFLSFTLNPYFFCRNLRRLVNAMILNRPPHEWFGAFRQVFCFTVFPSFCGFELTKNIMILMEKKTLSFQAFETTWPRGVRCEQFVQVQPWLGLCGSWRIFCH